MNSADVSYPFADRALARRLERTEGSLNAAIVAARAGYQPRSGAEWTEVAGTYAMFDGVGSPLTQTFGLGLFGEVGPAEFQALESFFEQRGAEVIHEVSPMADASLLTALGDRGFRPIELTNILVRPTALELPGATPGADPIVVRRIDPGEESLWSRVGSEGWGASPELASLILEMGEVVARSQGTLCFLAEAAGFPIATAALARHGGVAVLAGASTIPAARGRGAQRALLQARLRVAADEGCDLAMIGTHPGSASQRNAERQGFRLAYMRIKWGRRA